MIDLLVGFPPLFSLSVDSRRTAEFSRALVRQDHGAGAESTGA